MLRCTTLPWWRLFAVVTHPEDDRDDADVTRVVAVTMMENWRNVNFCIVLVYNSMAFLMLMWLEQAVTFGSSIVVLRCE